MQINNHVEVQNELNNKISEFCQSIEQLSAQNISLKNKVKEY